VKAETAEATALRRATEARLRDFDSGVASEIEHAPPICDRRGPPSSPPDPASGPLPRRVGYWPSASARVWPRIPTC
jgi:hypothetical protein